MLILMTFQTWMLIFVGGSSRQALRFELESHLKSPFGPRRSPTDSYVDATTSLDTRHFMPLVKATRPGEDMTN